MRASEDSRELPEEDRDGYFQGRIESSGESHGKPETSIEGQVNLNPTSKETERQKDFLGEGRRGYDPHMAELERQRARLIKERERQKKAAQTAQQRR